jgi:hypothetical protein
MIKFMYKFCSRKFANDDRNAMLFNTKLFALVDKYHMPSLKQLTTTRFVEASGVAQKDQLVAAIETTYTTTPSSIRGLREAAAEIAITHWSDLVEEKLFQDMMDRNSHFGRDLTTRAMSGNAKAWNGHGMVYFECAFCDLKVMLDMYKQGGAYPTMFRVSRATGILCIDCPVCSYAAKAKRVDKPFFDKNLFVKVSCPQGCSPSVEMLFSGSEENAARIRCPVDKNHMMRATGPA